MVKSGAIVLVFLAILSIAGKVILRAPHSFINLIRLGSDLILRDLILRDLIYY